VAVKVLRPGVERQVAQDSAVLRLAADLAERWFPPPAACARAEFVEVVIRSLDLELDLRFEAAGCAELGEAMAVDLHARAAGLGRGRQAGPDPDLGRGRALSDPAALDQPGLDRKALAENITGASWPRPWTTACSTPTCTRATCSSAAPREGGRRRRSTTASSAAWARASAATWPRSSTAS
jgi:hypothetical protein